jgi:hypothetical protein
MKEELAGRSLYHCVHPSDVGEFSKAWSKKDAGKIFRFFFLFFIK